MNNKDDIKTILATDCGSTTTKAILIENINNEYRLTFRGEAPTTVEAPFEDVTRGVLNSIIELEELSGRKILNDEEIITPVANNNGVDVYISTSSAGGGLQMMVGGVVKNMTGESAQRAALGAGSIVMDILASNDKRVLFGIKQDTSIISVEIIWPGSIKENYKNIQPNYYYKVIQGEGLSKIEYKIN